MLRQAKLDIEIHTWNCDVCNCNVSLVGITPTFCPCCGTAAEAPTKNEVIALKRVSVSEPTSNCIYCKNPGMYTLPHLGRHFDINGQEHACVDGAEPREESHLPWGTLTSQDVIDKYNDWMVKYRPIFDASDTTKRNGEIWMRDCFKAGMLAEAGVKWF